MSTISHDTTSLQATSSKQTKTAHPSHPSHPSHLSRSLNTHTKPSIHSPRTPRAPITPHTPKKQNGGYSPHNRIVSPPKQKTVSPRPTFDSCAYAPMLMSRDIVADANADPILTALLWNNSSEKCTFTIPQTVFLDPYGRIEMWLFTAKDGQILRKTSLKSTATILQKVFVEEALKDSSNLERIICATRNGNEVSYLRGHQFLELCEELKRIEECDDIATHPSLPRFIQVYTRPISDCRLIADYSIDADSQIVCDVHAEKIYLDENARRGASDCQIRLPMLSASLISCVRREVMKLLSFLERSYRINITHLQVEFIQNEFEKLMLHSINELDCFSTSPKPKTTGTSFSSRPPSVYDHSLSPSRVSFDATIGPQSRAASTSGFRTPDPARCSSANDLLITIMGSEAPNPSPRKRVVSAPASTQRSRPNLAAELMKEIDQYKSRIASVYAELSSCSTALCAESSRADALCAEHTRVSNELAAVERDKAGLRETLAQRWREATAQAKDLHRHEQRLQQLEREATETTHEKASLAQHLSKVIVELRTRLERVAAELTTHTAREDELRTEIRHAEREIATLREQRDLDRRRRQDAQTALGHKGDPRARSHLHPGAGSGSGSGSGAGSSGVVAAADRFRDLAQSRPRSLSSTRAISGSRKQLLGIQTQDEKTGASSGTEQDSPIPSPRARGTSIGRQSIRDVALRVIQKDVSA